MKKIIILLLLGLLLSGCIHKTIILPSTGAYRDMPNAGVWGDYMKMQEPKAWEVLTPCGKATKI